MEQLRISAIQTLLKWQDVNENRDNFMSKIDSLKEPVDIIVLPEMFSTGFVMQPEAYAETMQGSTVLWMQKTAQIKNTVLIGSIIIKDHQNYTNRLIVAFPNGKTEYYDKRHLFSLAGENNHYTQGNKKLIVEYQSWRILTLICYDLRFPVWSRYQNDYDALIYIANWPASRSLHWKTLLQARAIENQAYVIGVNRIGKDGNDTPHSGDSCIFDPFGKLVSSANPDEDTIINAVLEKSVLDKIRKSYPFYNDSDKFTLV